MMSTSKNGNQNTIIRRTYIVHPTVYGEHMQTFLLGIIIKVLSDERVQKMIKDLLGNLITERIVPLIPVAVTAAVDAVVKQIPGVDNIKDLGSVADTVRNTLNDLIPDIDLPVIGDLTDFWRPQG